MTQSHIESPNRLIGNYKNITQDPTEAKKKFLMELVYSGLDKSCRRKMIQKNGYASRIAANIAIFETFQSVRFEAVIGTIQNFISFE
ncbi:10398_t:CDS:2 [Acaulospora morrowiae]|uniref:10398_t:CDS:1 n=1 Tax=Acaulospora morrowiae TaxID=94023 RepID=A0A9N9EIY9_9GLOM|nr:10398_t:CDS:2 [Acaulospora morrowiae]